MLANSSPTADRAAVGIFMFKLGWAVDMIGLCVLMIMGQPSVHLAAKKLPA